MHYPASKTIVVLNLHQQQQQHEKSVNIAMNFKQTHGKDALYYLITQKHELMALDFDPSSWCKNCICIKQGSLITEGACGYGDLHKASYGKHSVGLSTTLFNRGTTCGACYEIRCVDHILWCVLGSPSVIVTTTDFCPPNYGLSVDYGGWCNFPRQHFELSQPAFSEIAKTKADIIPVQYKRVKCERSVGMKFTMSGSSHFYQVLITNVGQEGEVFAVKVKGSRTGWIPMARNWGMNWHCNVNLQHQPLSFEVTSSTGKTLASYNVAPSNWQLGQTFQGKQF
ncbi:Expansin-A20 [Lathyrus oleraceus]|uniref:Expansin n=1 Tax=Pisum sativum TaxID=3888 RepID=A0A9D4XBX0_PEA|nr:Expansin-A20 [Pisum sativum]